MEATMMTYGAYGEHDKATVRAAYCGEVIENDTGWYLLGERIYHPGLRRFLGPDTHSPFDDGGFNRYAYCGGDPINRVDPTGTSFWKWFGVALGVVGAVIATVATAGIAAAGIAAAGVTPMLVATVSASAVSIAADVASIAATLANKPQLAMILGFVGLATGLAGGVAGSVTTGVTKLAQLGKRATGNIRSGLTGLGRRTATTRSTVVSRATVGLASRSGRATSSVARRGSAASASRVSVSAGTPRRSASDAVTASRNGRSAASTDRRASALLDGASPPPDPGSRIRPWYKRIIRVDYEKKAGLGPSQFIGETMVGGGAFSAEVGALAERTTPATAPPPGGLPPYGHYDPMALDPWNIDLLNADLLNIDPLMAYQLP